MLFNSIAFLIFLPLVFAVHWLLPHRFRWILLLAASYYFYMSWNVKYVVLILFVTVISYIMAILIEESNSKLYKQLFLSITIVSCLGILFFFKYFNFFSQSLTRFLQLFALPIHPVTLKLMLPVGISFYTFQTLSYVIDVYRGTVSAEKHLGFYALFVSFFPQLVAGPIERTSNLLPQLKKERQFSYEQGMTGVRHIIWGFFKKVAVADIISPVVDQVFNDLPGYHGIDYFIVLCLFAVQIYCDFSGYSDIAVGTAKLLGIDLMKNFKSPYFSCSIQEYWSRWHISLSQWFRDYLYIPLGGSRCSKWKHYRNILVTFLVSGLWHGASGTYVLWGGLHGCIQVFEQILKKPLAKFKEKPVGRLFCSFAVFNFCNVGWILFRADSFTDSRYIFSHILDDVLSPSLYFRSGLGLSVMHTAFILIGILFVWIFDYVDSQRDAILAFGTIPKWGRCIIGYVLIVFVIAAAISGQGANQFVYFQF
ncbi:MAG: MBOAT family protein [Oscillospiraceae bacterium]|nr:MBOAT family protein [Oscillospiraceae bacterium]